MTDDYAYDYMKLVHIDPCPTCGETVDNLEPVGDSVARLPCGHLAHVTETGALRLELRIP